MLHLFSIFYKGLSAISVTCNLMLHQKKYFLLSFFILATVTYVTGYRLHPQKNPHNYLQGFSIIVKSTFDNLKMLCF